MVVASYHLYILSRKPFAGHSIDWRLGTDSFTLRKLECSKQAIALNILLME